MKKKSNWYFASFIFSCLLIFNCTRCYQWDSDRKYNNILTIKNKQKGVHLFGSVDTLSFQHFTKNNFEWVTYVPWGDQKDYDSPRIASGVLKDSVNLARKDSIWRTQINLAHQAGLKVFLKPHIWIYQTSAGKWRSDIFPSNEENWETWKSSYREFILFYARIAEETEVELFCIGVEFTRLALEKPEFWKQLIADVRKIYSGKLTYAANWYREYEKITFWDQLDFVGIQAYFPLVKNKNPSVKEISKGWQKHISSIRWVHQKFGKPILFTEMGYKSTEDSAIEPWTWLDYTTKSERDQMPVSTSTQMNCYQAFFDTVWKKDWLAGVHLWSCHVKGKGGIKNLDFTPKNKPAEKIIAKEFGKK